MLYAFLCYNNEATVYSWTKEEDDAVMREPRRRRHQPSLADGELASRSTARAPRLIAVDDVEAR